MTHPWQREDGKAIEDRQEREERSSDKHHAGSLTSLYKRWPAVRSFSE